MSEATQELQANGNIASQTQTAVAPVTASHAQPTAQNVPPPAVPLTSAADTGASKRPRDARLIHMLLTSLGITAYQERVPLLLLDFAYRHTSSLLSDALHLSSDAYISQQTRAKDPPVGGALKDSDGNVTMAAIQLAIQSRQQYQFNGGNGGGLSKEFLMEIAEQRNKIGLPRAGGTDWGIRLPAEKFVLSGVGWGLTDGWDIGDEGDGEEEGEEEEAIDVAMGGLVSDVKEEGVDGEGVEGGTVEDMFGEDLEDENMDAEDS